MITCEDLTHCFLNSSVASIHILRAIVYPNFFRTILTSNIMHPWSYKHIYSFQTILWLPHYVSLICILLSNTKVHLLPENLRYNSKFRIQDENEIIFKFLIMFLKQRAAPHRGIFQESFWYFFTAFLHNTQTDPNTIIRVVPDYAD